MGMGRFFRATYLRANTDDSDENSVFRRTLTGPEPRIYFEIFQRDACAVHHRLQDTQEHDGQVGLIS